MMLPPQAGVEADVFVVDDTPENLRLLTDLLRQNNFSVRSAISGKAALNAIAQQAPNVILLDVRMPEMDGYQVCQQLKAQKETQDIPVIFISGLDEIEGKVAAFKAGGVDYVTKPFHVEEVLSRVRTHLKISRLQQALTFQNEHLEQLVEKRTEELVEANGRLAILSQTKSDFLTLISHELRTPLNGLLGSADMVFAQAEENPLISELRQMYDASRQRLLTLLEHALLLAEMQMHGGRFASNTSSLDGVLVTVLSEIAPFARSSDVKLIHRATNLGKVAGDWVFLRKALFCLLETAIKFAPPGTQVELRGQPAPGEVQLTIESHGVAIPEPDLPRFFEILANTKTFAPGGDLGLAPAVAERIITLLGGRVQVGNLHPAGVQFQAWFPHLPPGD